MTTLPKIYHLAIYLLSFALISCSSGLRESESIADKMSRYDAKRDVDTSVPQLVLNANIYQSDSGVVEKGRGPASKAGGESFDFGQTTDGVSDRTSYSNRSLYYVTLLSQYQRLRGFASIQTTDINSCPSFHSMQLEFIDDGGAIRSGRKQWKKEVTLQQLHDKSYLSHLPEFFLPVVSDGTTPKVVDLLQSRSPVDQKFVSSTVQKALDIHIQKTYQELSLLCEKGVSTNYYNFENLITHVKRSPDFSPSKQNLQVLFKTTLFVNMAVIDSILPQDSLVKTRKRGRGIASQEAFSAGRSYERQVIKRLRVPWVGSYLQQLH
jgi:hypothetical protein